MGCRGSKEAAAEATAAKESAEESLPLPDAAAEGADDGFAASDARDGRRQGFKMDSTVVGKVLDLMGASNEQIAFFSVWATHVHDPAIGVAEVNGQQLYVSTDMRFLEVRVTGLSALMKNFLRNFVDRVRELPKKSIDELEMLLTALQDDANMVGSKTLTVWCKFKHCRSDAPPPSVDCGYILNQDLQWAVIDVMMPSHEDEDALREYALGERHTPVLYGSSILPVAPEKQLGFNLQESATQNARQILLTAFFFFKALGLMKPEDRIVRLLNSCHCERLVVCAGLGPEGLVRLSLSLIDPKNRQVAKDLADELACQYREKDIVEIQELMGGEPDIVDYVGETRGYGIRLGFVC